MTYTISAIIRRISSLSDRSGDKLLIFLDRYDYHGLREANFSELEEYLAELENGE